METLSKENTKKTTKENLQEDWERMHNETRQPRQSMQVVDPENPGATKIIEPKSNVVDTQQENNVVGGTPSSTPTGTNVEAVENFYKNNSGKESNHTIKKGIAALGDAVSSFISTIGTIKGGVPSYAAEGSQTDKLAKYYQSIYDNQQKNKSSYLDAYLKARKQDAEDAQNFFLNDLKEQQLALDTRKADATERYNDKRNELTEMLYEGRISDMEFKQELAKAKQELEELKAKNKMIIDEMNARTNQKNAETSAKNADTNKQNADTNKQKVEQNSSSSGGISGNYGSSNEKEKLNF